MIQQILGSLVSLFLLPRHLPTSTSFWASTSTSRAGLALNTRRWPVNYFFLKSPVTWPVPFPCYPSIRPAVSDYADFLRNNLPAPCLVLFFCFCFPPSKSSSSSRIPSEISQIPTDDNSPLQFSFPSRFGVSH